MPRKTATPKALEDVEFQSLSPLDRLRFEDEEAPVVFVIYAMELTPEQKRQYPPARAVVSWTMKQGAKRKSYTQMSTAELAAATKPFERPISFAETRPLSPALRAKEALARAARDTPQKTIRVKVDAALPERFDAFARRNNMTRDEFIARSLRSETAFVD